MKKWILTACIAALFQLPCHGQADPPYGMSQLEAYSVFSDAIRNEEHDMALTFGVWMLEAKPREISGVSTFTLPRQFRRLIIVYTDLAEKEQDPSVKQEHLGKALEIFDLAFETFTEEEIDLFRWHQEKGRFMQEHHRNLNAGLSDAFDAYEKAYRLDPERFAETGEGYFAQILLANYVAQNQRDEAMAMIDEIERYASGRLKVVINETRDQLFNSPEERIGFLQSRLENTEDGNEKAEMLQLLGELYEQTGRRGEAAETAKLLYGLNPDYANTRRLADLHLSDGEYEQALNFLKEALEKTPSDKIKTETLLDIAETYQQLENPKEARNYARMALQTGTDRASAYLRISSVYIAAISQCTNGRVLSRDDRTVYWLVLDYLEKARDADPEIRAMVNRRIESYSTALPTIDDKFFRGWETGASFRIDGDLDECYAWIDETTTVR